MGSARARVATCVVLVLGSFAWLAASPVRAVGPFSFPHRPHLSAAAIAACGTAGGSDADCRTCHDYRKGEREAHLVGCDKCHVDDKHLEKKTSGAYERPAFQHKEHLFEKDGSVKKDITCFTCHAMRVDYDFIDFSVPSTGLGPKGLGGNGGGAHGEKTCADCHAAHEPTGGLVKQDDVTGDGKACALCHLNEKSILPLKYRGDPRPAASKSFVHSDHGGRAGECVTCHAGIKTSLTIWDYDPTKGTAEQCATCHVGKEGPLVKPADEPPSPLKNVDFENFPHVKHYGEFSGMKCATCHYPETDEQGRRVFPGRVASSEPVGRSALVNFKACDACHGHDAWKPDKKSWHVEGHGVGAWACFKCHEGVVDANKKLAMATAKVTRPALGESNITAHAHPGITSGGARLADATQKVGDAQKACADCHVGDIVALTSRLVRRNFAHDPHLPTNPTNADCEQCHATCASARRSEDLTRFDSRVVRADAKTRGCVDCHVGASAADLGLGAMISGPVPQFDHANHVRSASLVAGEKGIACVECHVPGGKVGYQVPPDVANCTKCHGHAGDEAKIKRTGPMTSKKGDEAVCGNCHGPLRGESSGSIRMPHVEAPARQHLVLAANGVQFHDKSRDCAACHARDGLDAAKYVERITSAKVLKSIHEDAAFADRDFNKPTNKPFADAECSCRKCHRVEPRGYLKALTR
jgi:hypothetical protein